MPFRSFAKWLFYPLSHFYMLYGVFMFAADWVVFLKVCGYSYLSYMLWDGTARLIASQSACVEQKVWDSTIFRKTTANTFAPYPKPG